MRGVLHNLVALCLRGRKNSGPKMRDNNQERQFVLRIKKEIPSQPRRNYPAYCREYTAKEQLPKTGDYKRDQKIPSRRSWRGLIFVMRLSWRNRFTGFYRRIRSAPEFNFWTIIKCNHFFLFSDFKIA